jgi:hypothetical protein
MQRWKRMSTQLLLEERHVVLKNEIGEKLQKKHVLELEITRQFEELKRVEISLEKHAHSRAL